LLINFRFYVVAHKKPEALNIMPHPKFSAPKFCPFIDGCSCVFNICERILKQDGDEATDTSEEID